MLAPAGAPHHRTAATLFQLLTSHPTLGHARDPHSVESAPMPPPKLPQELVAHASFLPSGAGVTRTLYSHLFLTSASAGSLSGSLRTPQSPLPTSLLAGLASAEATLPTYIASRAGRGTSLLFYHFTSFSHRYPIYPTQAPSMRLACRQVYLSSLLSTTLLPME